MSVSCFQQMSHIDVHQNCHVELFSGKIKTLIYLSKQILVSLKKKKKKEIPSYYTDSRRWKNKALGLCC